MILNKLFLKCPTPQSSARRNNLERLVDAVRNNPHLPVEKAIETYFPKNRQPKSFSKFVQRNLALLEAIYRSKPEIGVEIVLKAIPNNLGNRINWYRLVPGQMYEVRQIPKQSFFKKEDFIARLKEKHFILGFPYLIFEDNIKVDVCFSNVTVKAV